MKYRILQIQEDIDFGCEEKMDDDTVMAVVTLEDSNGHQIRLRYPDQKLYDDNMNEGDIIILNEKQEIVKPISGDWTRDFSSKDLDSLYFSEMLQQVRMGKKPLWICPFCGGKVGLLEKTDDMDIIGCDSCDMRITLETT